MCSQKQHGANMMGAPVIKILTKNGPANILRIYEANDLWQA